MPHPSKMIHLLLIIYYKKLYLQQNISYIMNDLGFHSSVMDLGPKLREISDHSICIFLNNSI
jgi:hypothetical protein